MLALLCLLLIPLLMWLGQSALLWRAGLPAAARLGANLPRALRGLNRIVTNAALLAGLLVYPLALRRSPLEYYGQFFPGGAPVRALGFGAGAAILYLSLLHLAWLVTDQVRFGVRHSPGRLVRRLAGVPFAALLVAVVEELLFRGVLLADLLRTLRPEAAVPLAALLFAAAHYVRRVKRYWTFAGHVALGLLFCTAFALTGGLWLPIGLHAGGVLVLLTVRPLIRYTGPPWLVGASIFPYAGAVGILALLLLTGNILLVYRNSG